MSRIIKFRAWCAHKKEWEKNPMFLAENGQLFHMMRNGQIIPLKEDMHIAMQFTGLLDKNGKEIYEGDIVIWHGDKDRMFEVFYNDNDAKFDCCRVHYRGQACGASIPYMNNKPLEIIGNIYENIELLAGRPE